MARWLDRVDELLYEGETIVEEVRYGDEPGEGPGPDLGFLPGTGGDESGVVVTTHRVLAFTPDSAGRNFEDVDRPNVQGVSPTERGDVRFLLHASKAIVLGLVMVVAGSTIDLDRMVGGINIDTAGAGRIGMGGMLQTMQTVLELLALLDDALRTGGALALLAGVSLMGAYILTRERVLEIEVAGDEEDDLVLPAPDEGEVVDRLERAIDDPGPDSQKAGAGGQPDGSRRA